MKQLFKNMIRWLLGVLPVVLTVTNAMAQKPVHQFEVEQCESIEFSVVEWPGDRYTWDLYTELDWDTVDFVNQNGNVEPVPYFEDGMYQGSTVTVNWLDPGRYIVRVVVWDEKTCTNNMLIFSVNVLEHIVEGTVVGDSMCYGDPVVFKIILTGTPPWDVEYTYDDGTAVLNLNGIVDAEQIVTLPPLPAGTHEMWITQIIDQCSINLIPSEKGRIVIYPKPPTSDIYPVKK